MSKSNKNKIIGFNTRTIHGSAEKFSDPFQALEPPVYLNSSYFFDSSTEAAAVFAGEKERFVYGRVHNPTQALLELRLADLEGCEAGVAFSSGMGAISSLFWSHLQSGDEIIAHNRMYGNTYNLLTKELPKFNINVKLIDMTDLQQLHDAISSETRFVFFEIPSNPLLELIDIASVAVILNDHPAKMVVDSTLASPIMLRPIENGADIVVHSLTKYISGHGDVLGGILLGSKKDIKTVRMHGLRCMTGATIAPLSAYLVLRGLKTLSIRMQKHSENAIKVAQFLEDHSAVHKVYFPGLESHAQFQLARDILEVTGGLISFELNGDLLTTQAFIDKLQLIKHAVSLGDVGTLIQHPASMTHSGYSNEKLLAYGIGPTLVRISVGLENIQDIIADLTMGLAQ